MTGSRLIRILGALTAEELFQLRQFIQSPLFNNGQRPQKTQLLLEELAKFLPTFDAAGLEKERLYQAVFPDQAFQTGKLDKLASELMQVVRKFLVVRETLHAPEGHHWLAQARFFRKKNMGSEFFHAIGQVEKWHGEIMVQEEDYFYTKFLLEEERVKNLVNINDNKGDLNISATIHSLDVYYIVLKLIHCSHLLTKTGSTSLDLSQPSLLFEEILEAAEKNFLHIPIVATYYSSCSLLLKRNEQKHYNNLKNILETNKVNFSTGLLKDMHSILRNHITDQYNLGNHALLPELFTLLKDHDSQGTLLQESGTILASTLQNAITVALKLGEVDWAFDFLQRHRNCLVGADDPEAIYEFNMANCHFHRGDFGMVEKCLARYQYRSVFYKLAARRMEIKLYYETNSPLLDPRLDAFKIFVHELKSILPSEKIVPNNHFADLMRQLLAPKTLGNTARIQKLLEKMATQKAVAEREWLQAKLEAMLVD